MDDDAKSVKLRKVHREWMDTTARGAEAAEMAATIADAHPSLFLRAMARFINWLAAICRREEEKARKAARETYR